MKLLLALALGAFGGLVVGSRWQRERDEDAIDNALLRDAIARQQAVTIGGSLDDPFGQMLVSYWRDLERVDSV